MNPNALSHTERDRPRPVLPPKPGSARKVRSNGTLWLSPLGKRMTAQTAALADHRFLGFQLLYKNLIFMHNLGLRSDQTVRSISVAGGPARWQTHHAHNGKHAAHANPAAGVIGNVFTRILEDIKERENAGLPPTPKSQKILSLSGLERADISQIQEVFEAIDRGTDESEFRLEQNSTTSVERNVNLLVDKRYEAYIRPHLVKVFKSVQTGTKTPREGIEEIVSLSSTFFTSSLDAYERKRKILSALLRAPLSQRKKNITDEANIKSDFAKKTVLELDPKKETYPSDEKLREALDLVYSLLKATDAEKKGVPSLDFDWEALFPASGKENIMRQALSFNNFH